MRKYLVLALLAVALSPAQAQYITTVAGGNGPGSDSNQFYYSYGLFLDGSGNIYVSDQNNNRIQKFPPGSTAATDGITVAGGNGQLNNPAGVFVDSSGNLYVADQDNNRILKFPPRSNAGTNGISVAGNSGAGNLAFQLDVPTGIFVDHLGNLYVADADNNRIQMFAPGSSTGVTVAGGRGLGDNAWQLSYPTAVYLDTSGNIYVADYLNNRIQKFTPPDTNAVTVAGGNGMGSGPTQLNSPTGVFVDRGGTIYVADFYNSRIQRFPPGSTSDTTGVTVAGGNGEGDGADQLNDASSVYVDTTGAIYIADYLNNRVQKWNPSALGVSGIPSSQGNISLYPNPNSGSFILESSDYIGKEFMIYDLIGRTVAQGEIVSEKQSIQIPNMSAGAYTLEIKGSADKAIRFTVE
jgi:sugar lactone lactonase YvrE